MTGLDGVLFTNAVAHRQGKAPFFFSQWNFDRARQRGNSHFCFDCGGEWGFIPSKDGEPLNCQDEVFELIRPDGSLVRVQDALNDPELAPFLADTARHPRRTPDQRSYNQWLSYPASFLHTDKLEANMRAAGYAIGRHNPMSRHDPITHADAIVGGMNNKRYHSAWDWLRGEKLPEDFPYIVTIT